MSNNPRAEAKKSERDWYSVSYTSAKRTIQLLVFVVVVIGGAAFYQQWEHQRKRDRAEQLIEEAGQYTARIAERSDYAQIRREYYTAWDSFDGAKGAFDEEKYSDAIRLGENSIREFENALQTDIVGVEGRGQFLSVEGNVEYRRGDRGAWKRARPQDVVNPGDWVKTSAGASAQITFPGGDVYTLRANTLINLSIQTDRFGRRENVADIPFGRLELTAGSASSRVTTPKAEAKVEGGSEVGIAFDREREQAEFESIAGQMEVTSESGQTRILSGSQKVVQEGDALSATLALPERPTLYSPPDDRDLDLKDGEMRLTWAPVPGASSYALQVSKNRLFASKVIDDPDRDRTSATLGLRREGVFYWQVAAVNGNGVRGPWSEPRTFRVANLRSADPNDTTPPPLTIEELQTFGSLLIVTGRTESGVAVKVNGEDVEVQPDGSFSKTVQVDQEGFSFVEVVATDERGNSASEERRVFFDSSY